MALQLAQIVHSRPDSEQLQLVEVKVEADRATVVLKAASWWEANSSMEERLITVQATGLQEAEIVAHQKGKNFQIFSFSSDDSLLWDYGNFAHIYGKAPLPDPFRFFWEFSETLNNKFNLPRKVQSYLSIKTNLREWEVMCYNRAFLMMTVPEPFLPELTDLFYSQAFEYTVLNDDTRNPVEGLSALRFGESWVIAKDYSVQKG